MPYPIYRRWLLGITTFAALVTSILATGIIAPVFPLAAAAVSAAATASAVCFTLFARGRFANDKFFDAVGKSARETIDFVETSALRTGLVSLSMLAAGAGTVLLGPHALRVVHIRCYDKQLVTYQGVVPRSAQCEDDSVKLWSPLEPDLSAIECQATDPDRTHRHYPIRQRRDGVFSCRAACDELEYLEWGPAPRARCSSKPSLYFYMPEASDGHRCQSEALTIDTLQRDFRGLAARGAPGFARLTAQLTLESTSPQSLWIVDGGRKVPIAVSYAGEGTAPDGRVHMNQWTYGFTRFGTWCNNGREYDLKSHR